MAREKKKSKLQKHVNVDSNCTTKKCMQKQFKNCNKKTNLPITAELLISERIKPPETKTKQPKTAQ